MDLLATLSLPFRTGMTHTDTIETTLIQAAQGGDEKAFAELVKRYQRPVYALCNRYLRGSEAEDVAQETFVKAFLHVREIDSARPILPWLYTVARNLCLDRLRRRKFEANVEPSPNTASAEPSVDDAVAGRIDLERLKTAFAALPEGPREALALFHLEGMAYQDIATTLEVPIGTVMTWIFRGRKELKKALPGRHHEER